MSKSDLNVESVISRVETALRFRSNHLDSPSIDQLLAEIQSAMTQWPNAREMLGPLIGKLRAVKSSTAESPINWIPVLQGHLAIGHRPKIKIIKNLRSLGATHVLTLLSESEGAEDIGKEVQGAGIDWIWLPFHSADPPSEDRLAGVIKAFDVVRAALDKHARIYVHCSAGIHRTGMITYAFLRYIEFSAENAMTTLSKLRQVTADGVGEDRKHWGEQFG